MRHYDWAHTMQVPFTPRERIADNIIHLTGLAAGFTAVLAMMVAAFSSLPAVSTASLAIYGAGMLTMLGCSAAYHMIPVVAWKGFLQRLDHAAIFLKIAGTYTPFGAIKIGGTTGLALLGTVWSVALLCSGAKILLASTWDRLSLVLYLALGWCGIVMLQDLAASVTLLTLILLGMGGVLYTVGVIFHVWRSLPYQKAIWHAFVLAGTGCHFGAVTSAVFIV
jgi:hemolysin III